MIMKTMKLYLITFVIIVACSLTGCIKDDNPYPDVVGKTWYRNEGKNYQKLSFTDNTVTHVVSKDGDVKTYTFNYTGGKANGTHYYYWINDKDNLRYVVLSYGEKHILLTSGDPSTMSDYVSDNYYYFTKEEDN